VYQLIKEEGFVLSQKLIRESDIEKCLSELSDSGDVLAELTEKLQQIKPLLLVPCGECPSYVRMEGGTHPGRCKRLGFWFPEDFSCGYCEENERRRRAKF